MAYPEEIKARARGLHEGGVSIANVARELGVPYQTARLWLDPEAAEAARQYQRRQRAENPDYRRYQSEYQRGYWQDYQHTRWANDPKFRKSCNQRKYAYLAKRSASDPSFRVLTLLRARLRSALRGRAMKSAGIQELLGCSPRALVERWDAIYGPGWANDGGLHIDHVRPCASFDFNDPGQQQPCFHWANLQLLPASENLEKRDRWTAEDEIGWAWRMRSLGYEGELYLVFLGSKGEGSLFPGKASE